MDKLYIKQVVKNIIYFILSLIGVFIGIKISIFYTPFLIAFILAIIIEPIIRYLMKKFNLKRKISSIIVFTISISIIIAIIVIGTSLLIQETFDLIKGFNQDLDRIYDSINKIIQSLDLSKLNIPQEWIITIQEQAILLIEKTSQLLKTILDNTVMFISKLPQIALYVVITVLALYFITTDKIYILDQLEHHLPRTWVRKILKHIKDLSTSLGKYIRAQLVLVLISFIISLISFYIFKTIGFDLKYPFLIAILIAFVDLLPIFGSGTVMIPWSIYLGCVGQYNYAIAILALWIIMSIVRQLIEPKIVSNQLGIHPIFTLIAMYTGFKFFGIIGLFIGTLILIICKNIFANNIDNGIVKSMLEEKD